MTCYQNIAFSNTGLQPKHDQIRASAEGSYLVNVGMPDFGDESDAGRRVRVVSGELHVSLHEMIHNIH